MTAARTPSNVVVLSPALIRLTRIKRLALALPAAWQRGINCDRSGDTLGARDAFAEADRIYSEMMRIKQEGRNHG